MLKLPRDRDERRGTLLMRWWAGRGAARVFRFDGTRGSVLLERARGPLSLAQ